MMAPDIVAGDGPAAAADALRRAASVAAVLAFGFDTWADLGPHLTCSETEEFAEFLRAHGARIQADTLIEGHAPDDTFGDLHFTPEDQDDALTAVTDGLTERGIANITAEDTGGGCGVTLFPWGDRVVVISWDGEYTVASYRAGDWEDGGQDPDQIILPQRIYAGMVAADVAAVVSQPYRAAEDAS